MNCHPENLSPIHRARGPAVPVTPLKSHPGRMGDVMRFLKLNQVRFDRKLHNRPGLAFSAFVINAFNEFTQRQMIPTIMVCSHGIKFGL